VNVSASAGALRTSTFFRKGALLFFGTTLAVIALDQWTKGLARTHLLGNDGDGPRSIPLLGEYIRLTYVQNRGAAFGLLQDQTTFFILVGVIVIVVIIASYRQLKEPGWLLNLCLGLQMGGALGNLVDRIRYGYVVDFVDLTFWPVFNVADSAICVGVALLAWSLMFRGQAHS
jgi:signal peptidase II